MKVTAFGELEDTSFAGIWPRGVGQEVLPMCFQVINNDSLAKRVIAVLHAFNVERPDQAQEHDAAGQACIDAFGIHAT